MIRNLSKAFLLSLLLIPAIALADIAVLVHGFHSSSNIWRKSRIINILATHGWRDAGYYLPVQGNVAFSGQGLNNQSPHQLVTAELPSDAPIEIQADLLGQYLKDIHQRFPDQMIHLIGYSAGGMVARLSLVHNSDLPVVQLITIASPHLGTPIAEFARLTKDTPFGFIAPIAGIKELDASKRLFKQLSREKENYFLFWLNRQPHPEILYTSIIRADDSIMKGDIFVPSYSQNMAFVPAIGKRAEIIMTPGNHYLKPTDGYLLLNLLT